MSKYDLKLNKLSGQVETDRCPNLKEWSDWIILRCNSGNKRRVPDLYKVEKHCKSKNYNKCSYYAGAEEPGSKEERKYYQ